MNYLSLEFWGFIFIFLLCYYAIPPRHRYIAIFVGSYIFYGATNWKILVILFGITLITYWGGILIEKRNRRCWLRISLIIIVGILVVFKYLNFSIGLLNRLLIYFNLLKNPIAEKTIIYPVGLSFIIFQSITYLTDVYRSRIKADNNFLHVASFIAFFPTILSGPIQKSRELLPQISNPREFDGEMAKKGTILFVWGAFEKIMVSNKLLMIINRIFNNYIEYNSAYYIVAAIAFSIYIYADFSSYSDMARGIAKIMGIEITKNFNNPYLSITTSEFWNRWHISLNNWFLENIYIPLGGNRKGTLRKYINVFVVFAISGLWHGADYHFVVWGIANGILVIVGQVIKPIKSRIYQKMGVDEKCESIILIKRIIVFWLITLTWVFFNNSVCSSFYIIKRMILFNPINFFDENLLSISGSVVTTFITMLSCYIFYRVQKIRINEAATYLKFCKQPLVLQALCVAFIICICIFASCSVDAAIDNQFLYFQF